MESFQQTFNWGIIGLGKIARKFATDLQAVENGNLYAVASRFDEKAKIFAEDFHAERFYGSYDELIQDPKVDVVYIATPHVFHCELTMRCLKAKKPVLCEKAFGMNKEEVIQMIELAKKENVFLMEALWTHFLPHYQYVIELLQEKKYGAVKSLEADFGFEAPYDVEKRLFNKKLGGGSLLDIGIYPVFAAMSLLGDPENISAEANLTETEVDMDCKIIFEYPNNVKAKLYSTLEKKTPTECIITCENGTIKINGRFHEPSSVTIKSEEGEKTIEFPVITLGYNFEAAHVQKMLQQGKKESTVMTFDKSKRLIALLDEVRAQIKLDYK